MRIRKDLLDRTACETNCEKAICPRCGRPTVMGVISDEELDEHWANAYLYRFHCHACGHAHTEFWKGQRPIKVVIHKVE